MSFYLRSYVHSYVCLLRKPVLTCCTIYVALRQEVKRVLLHNPLLESCSQGARVLAVFCFRCLQHYSRLCVSKAQQKMKVATSTFQDIALTISFPGKILQKSVHDRVISELILSSTFRRRYYDNNKPQLLLLIFLWIRKQQIRLTFSHKY